MIEITSIQVEAATTRGPVKGSLQLYPGLNVLSAENAYGKSLAMTAVPWCLGLEAMFGVPDNDASRFPTAVRDVLDIGTIRNVDVVSSVAQISLRRDDGAILTISRPIKGTSPEFVDVVEGVEGGAASRTSRLLARRKTLKDESGGLQHFLFEWLGLPRAPLMNFKGERAELYLENVAPLFFIDQNEGWTDLQALQVYRYQLQEVCEAAFEYMLGATSALLVRFRRQENVSLDARLKGEAEKIAEQVEDFFERTQGWDLTLSIHGSPGEIAKRWAARSLSTIVRDDFNMDTSAERTQLDGKIGALRAALASDPIGSSDSAPSTQPGFRSCPSKDRAG